jgi:hypothetical protein
MRIPRGFVLCFTLVLAGSIAGGCAGDPTVTTSGSGGSSDVSAGDGVPFPEDTTSIGSGPSFPPGAWNKHYGGDSDQVASALAVNDAGDIALVGTASGTIDFGNFSWMGSLTDADVVVAKISHEGQTQWSRRYGDSCDQRGGAVANMPSGNVLLAGDFCGKMSFGKTSVETKGDEVDLFVAMIDTLGEDVYSKHFGGAGIQAAFAAASDSKGNAVIVGAFTTAFDDGTGEIAGAGLNDAFVLKLDPEGNLLWSRRFGGAGDDVARAVAIDATGNIVVGGSFTGSVDFGGGPLVAPPEHSGAFLVELDPDGNHLLSQSFASDTAAVRGVAIGADNRIAATGSFSGTVDVGAGPVTTAGNEDIFVVEVDSAGKVVWGHTFGGVGAEIGTGIAFGVGGTLAMTGTSSADLDFAGFTVTGNPDPYISYVIYLDPAGNVMSGWSINSPSPLQNVGVGFSGKLEATIAGSFNGVLFNGFGSFEPQTGWDIYLAHRP